MVKNPQHPAVSIIMPVYNAEKYLRESLDSVLRQSYVNFEFIIINDGSSDDSQKIITEYAARDARIVPVKQKNQGLVATLNNGIKKAKGKYIARIDGDDPWMEGKLAAQMSELEKDDTLVLIGGGFEIIDENGFFIETICPPTRDEDIRRALMLRNTFGHAGVVFKKSAVEEAGLYSNDHGPTEDYDMWIKLSKLGRLKNLSYPVYRYRINTQGISQQNSQRQAIETKKHAERLWQASFPRIMSRRELIVQSSRYLHQAKTVSHGIAAKEQFLADNAQIGIRLVRHGQIRKGLVQLFLVASVGRSGLKAVKKRFAALDTGSIKQIAE